MSRFWKAGVALVLVALLVACGGGGGSAGSCVFSCDGSTPGTSASDLTLVLSSASVGNSGSDTVTATVTAVDANRNIVSGAKVVFSTDDANAVVTPTGTLTDTAGTISALIGIGANKANRTITVKAVSNGISKSATLQVSGAKVIATFVPTVVPGSKGNEIKYLVTDVNASPLTNLAIAVSAPGLTSAAGVTDSTGVFNFTYDAPAVAGLLTVTAEVAGVTNQISINNQTTAIPDAAGPAAGSVFAAPNSVKVNISPGSTTNQTQVRALFMAAGNVPVANIRVRFDLANDVNHVGGTFGSGDNMLYSSVDGTVSTSYIPGTRSSPTDGVTVRACWNYTDFPIGACPNISTATLTVNAEAISVTLGTNALISEGAAKLTYIKQFVAKVVDSAGNAVSGATITPVIDIVSVIGTTPQPLTDPSYMKGTWVLGSSAWIRPDSAQVNGVGGLAATCSNEDLNRNGVLDSGEDINGNGKLEPRKADISVTMVNGSKTDADGQAVLQIEYPQNVATWDFYTLTVTASGVSGTEGKSSFSGVLPAPASVFTNTSSDPAFRVSPYGTAQLCSTPN